MPHVGAHVAVATVSAVVGPAVFRGKGPERLYGDAGELSDAFVVDVANVPASMSRLAPVLHAVDGHDAGELRSLYLVAVRRSDEATSEPYPMKMIRGHVNRDARVVLVEVRETQREKDRAVVVMVSDLVHDAHALMLLQREVDAATHSADPDSQDLWPARINVERVPAAHCAVHAVVAVEEVSEVEDARLLGGWG